MSAHRFNGELHDKLVEVHSDIKELSTAILELRDEVVLLKDCNRDSAREISQGVVQLSNSIRMHVELFKHAVPVKLVLIILLATIVAMGVGKQLDILLKIMQ